MGKLEYFHDAIFYRQVKRAMPTDKTSCPFSVHLYIRVCVCEMHRTRDVLVLNDLCSWNGWGQSSRVIIFRSALSGFQLRDLIETQISLEYLLGNVRNVRVNSSLVGMEMGKVEQPIM